MDIFTTVVLKRIGFAPAFNNPEVVLSLLGLVVEMGRKKFVEGVRGGESVLNHCLAVVDKELLLKDTHFLFSLYVAAIGAALKAEKMSDRKFSGEEMLAFLKSRISEIFPPDFSEKIFDYFLSNGGRLVATLRNQEGWEKAVSEHFAYREQLFCTNASIPIQQQNKKIGTQTWLVPCPSCGTEKRCDAKTKNFRCKCGFEKPYNGERKIVED